MKLLMIGLTLLTLTACGKGSTEKVAVNRPYAIEIMKCGSTTGINVCLSPNRIVRVKSILPDSRDCTEDSIKIIGQSEVFVTTPCRAVLLLEVE